MNTNLRFAVLLAVLLLLALVSSGCSDPLYYVVDNQTNEHLTTWGFHESCDQLISYRNDYAPERIVPPRQKYVYSKSTGGGGTQCIQIVDEQRRLVLAEPYFGATGTSEGRVYTVRSLEPIGPKLPEQHRLPEQSWLGGLGEKIIEEPLEIGFLIVALVIILPLFAIYLVLNLVAIVLVPKALYLGGKSIYLRTMRSLRRLTGSAKR